MIPDDFLNSLASEAMRVMIEDNNRIIRVFYSNHRRLEGATLFGIPIHYTTKQGPLRFVDLWTED